MDNDTENKILSEVHVHLHGDCVVDSADGTRRTVSRFIFKVPEVLHEKLGKQREIENSFKTKPPYSYTQNYESGVSDTNDTVRCICDEDGDIILQRGNSLSRVEGESAVITIEHAMATRLEDVGQQVWLGALLLCDFLLHVGPLLDGCVVLDLGAGVALTSIVAALMAESVYCTDTGDALLNLAQYNIELNKNLLPLKANVCVRSLNWMDTNLLETADTVQKHASDLFRLSAADVQALMNCNVILAAEVIYDLDLTDGFFRLLYKLMQTLPAKVAYISVEKRQVFSTAELDVVSPAYENFRENLKDLSSIDTGPVRFVCSQIDSNFPQYFQYQRSKELELWRIETIFTICQR